jgi:signal transduction histidine kinase
MDPGPSSFYISISNTGLPISGDEVGKVATRGFRAKSAIASTAQGQGIGLWVVKKIMEAHQGRLIVIPTTSSKVTEVRLVFPKAKVQAGDHASTNSRRCGRTGRMVNREVVP